MARKPRLHIPGASYYVLLRGRVDPPLMPGDSDRQVMLDILCRALVRYGVSLHAYALLESSVELAVTVGDNPVYKLVQTTVYRYKRAYRRRHGRVRSLLHGRYHACLVEQDTMLPAVIAHIHTAPVRAGRTREPEAFPWSGHRALLGEDTGPVDVGASLSHFATNPEQARLRYWGMTTDPAVLADETGLGHRLAAARAVGSPAFERRMEDPGSKAGRRPSLDDVVTAVCRAYGMTEADLRAPRRFRKPAEARAVVAWLAQATGAGTLTAVAERFGRDLATLSIAVSRLGERSGDTLRLARRLRDELLGRR